MLLPRLGGFWLLSPREFSQINESHPTDHDSSSSEHTNMYAGDQLATHAGRARHRRDFGTESQDAWIGQGEVPQVHVIGCVVLVVQLDHVDMNQVTLASAVREKPDALDLVAFAHTALVRVGQ